MRRGIKPPQKDQIKQYSFNDQIKQYVLNDHRSTASLFHAENDHPELDRFFGEIRDERVCGQDGEGWLIFVQGTDGLTTSEIS
jgi:hypothetical protein